MTEQSLRLADGRKLGYAEYGRATGKPFIYCHGFPSSRLEISLADNFARRRGIRLIAIDRPGVGLSDFQANRRLNDWPQDVAALADALKLKRVVVLGVSGGGPYALACAHALPERLQRVGIVCGLAPLANDTKTPLTAGMAWPAAAMLKLAGFPMLGQSAAYAAGAGVRLAPGWAVEAYRMIAPPADRDFLRQPTIRQTVQRAVKEAFRQGETGCVSDLLLYAQPWGFSLSDIRVPVLFWQGEEDSVVPPAMARYQIQRLPHCQAEFYSGEAHFSLAFGRMEEILQALMDED